MAVTVTSTISGPYIPNGATTVFAFDFKAGSADEIEVYRDLADGWEAVPGADYTASVNPDDEGGQVEFSIAPGAGTGDLYIVSTPLFTREGQYTGEGPFTPKGLNNQFDRAAVRDLALARDVGRSIKVPLGEEPAILPRVADRALKYLAFDADGQPLPVTGVIDLLLNEAVGVPAGSTDMGEPSGDLLTPSGTAKQWFAELEGAIEDVGPRNDAQGYVGLDADASARVPNDLRVGEPSFDGAGNFVEGAGRIRLGVSAAYPDGLIYIRQEGFPVHYEEGSWAVYPVIADRWCGLSIAPSGDPWDLPSENITSIALQLQNGASEMRQVLATKWFGDEGTGFGEYRWASFKNGTGEHQPLAISNNDARQIVIDTDGEIILTNEMFGGIYPGSAAVGGLAAGNTILLLKNPGAADSARFFARTTGEVGIESVTGAAVNWELRLNGNTGGPDIRGNQPSLWWSEADAPANNKRWFMDAAGGQLRLFAVNDAVNAFGQALGISRTAEVITEVALMGGVGAGALRLQPNKVGFFGAAPVAKPNITGSRGGNAALASLLTELANLGVITNGTTA